MRSAPAPEVPAWAAGLDEVQRRAVAHDGPALLIVAGAGTGKTRTLVARLARLIDEGLAPDRLLIVTFSRRAADELLRRLGHLVGAAQARQVHAGTFHSVAHRLLRQHGRPFGLGDGFSVIDQGDAADLMHLARQFVAAGTVDEARRRFPRKHTLVTIYSRVINAREPLRLVLRRSFPWVQEHERAIAQIFGAYTQRKRDHNLLDFDDLLLYWRAAARDLVVGPALAASYDHVLVDEYQDTNLLQADIVRSLRDGGRPITVVGDDAQAIYAFRAATVHNMLDFPAQFPGAAVIALERNYRSTQPILDLANAVLSQASEGYTKRLWTTEPGGPRPMLATCPDEGAQAGAVADVILEHHEGGVALHDQAVLFRSAHHSDVLEVELRRRGIPFVKYGGLRFLEAAHVRDLVAALRVLDNPRDELAWFRLLQLIEGIGPAGARRMMAALGIAEGDVDPLARFIHADVPLPAKSADAAQPLRAALEDCRGGCLGTGAEIERLRQGLEPLLRRRYDNVEVRLRDLDALGRVVGAYDSRARAVAELTLDPPTSTSDLAGPPRLDDDYLILSTVHSAKGGEWRVVHLIHAADGMFPSDLATGDRGSIEEERRLFYVALTRAREHLHIYAPLRYHLGGPFGRGDAHSYGQRTRFLPPEVDGLLQHRPVRTSRADSALPVPEVALPTAVDEAIRDLW
jgi:DNA helicase-2/ATP-dependent DNA helicase PcrA